MTTHMILTDGETTRDGWHLPSLAVPHLVWREAGDEGHERAVLFATLKIGDMSLRLAAIGIHLEHLDDEGETTSYPVTDEEAQQFDGCTIEFDQGARSFDAVEIWTAFGINGMPEFTTIEGRHYTIIAAPFDL